MSFTILEVVAEEAGFASKFALMDGNICIDRFDTKEEAEDALTAYTVEAEICNHIETDFDRLQEELMLLFSLSAQEALENIQEYSQIYS